MQQLGVGATRVRGVVGEHLRAFKPHCAADVRAISSRTPDKARSKPAGCSVLKHPQMVPGSRTNQ
jgi:hypothetical protein